MQKKFLKIILLALLICGAVTSHAAWVGPTGVAPSGNIAPAIHTGSAQSKSGSLTLTSGSLYTQGLRSYLDSYFDTKVGIGTTTPGAALEVNGQVKIDGGTPGAGKVLTSDAFGLASWVLPSSSQWTTSASNIYYNTGNVGIGIALPVAKLDVNGDGSFTGDGSTPNVPTVAGVTFGKSSTDTNRRIDITAPAGGSSYIDFGVPNTDYRGRILYNNASDFLSIYTGGFVERARMDASGNLGLGTTAPGAKLEVAGQVKITGGTPGAGKVLTSDAAGLASWTTPSASGGVTGSGTSGYLSKFTGTSALGNSQIYENASGNVAVGTQWPLVKFQVSGPSAASSVAQFGVIDDGVSKLSIDNGIGGGGAFAPVVTGVNNTSGPSALKLVGDIANLASSDTGLSPVMSFVTRASGNSSGSTVQTRPLFMFSNNNVTDLLRILQNGNVGIGNSTPTQKLDVNGYIRAASGFCIGASPCVTSLSSSSGIGGSGTTNYIPKFTAAGTVGNSQISDDGTTVSLSKIKITTGGGAGKVLTSDATGAGTWAIPKTYVRTATVASNGIGANGAAAVCDAGDIATGGGISSSVNLGNPQSYPTYCDSSICGSTYGPGGETRTPNSWTCYSGNAPASMICNVVCLDITP